MSRSSDLRDLYQEVILDHGKNPRNCCSLDNADGEADGHNPLCGDKVTVYVTVKDGMIERVAFTGSGCAISVASASMMSEALRGKSLEEGQRLFAAFHGLVTGGDDAPTDDTDCLGKLVVFSGVRDFPVRVKCATLAWHTLRAALDRRDETISTE